MDHYQKPINRMLAERSMLAQAILVLLSVAILHIGELETTQPFLVVIAPLIKAFMMFTTASMGITLYFLIFVEGTSKRATRIWLATQMAIFTIRLLILILLSMVCWITYSVHDDVNIREHLSAISISSCIVILCCIVDYNNLTEIRHQKIKVL